MYTYYDLHYTTNHGTEIIVDPMESLEAVKEFTDEYKAATYMDKKAYTVHKVVRKWYREIISDEVIEVWSEN